MRHCFLKIPPLLNAAPLGTRLLTHQPLETSQSQATVGECRLSQVGCASRFRTVGVCSLDYDVLAREDLCRERTTSELDPMLSM